MSLLNYFKDTRSEMKHVSWPTRKQVINFTLLVLLICILTGIFLGLFDFLFTTGLKALILK
ncbi:MAG: preprotein translocase subunit SecE [Candidatus Vogelbacteria bacterium CG22_combo_CG10-13_8_21_14_all_37_9]|uniref:Protein translocase subunit SecE n=1 Tax=Candidatus Vogelbacteria bacterium CG22_combo_CG10-13_8_21_14_all_37_9 TaxID=1975046 RepID=A0A2H0BKQ5_9BACT|nr:MAG: preprotein translocase subunit SecE [Candidatus Vogelbacteria bacterium CG22_combo_CG10-13_8_21_14_all_37_9]